MNTADLFAMNVLVGIDADGGLVIDAPRGALTPDLIERIRASKPALIAELARLQAQKAQPFDSCRYCAHHRRPGIGNRYCGGRSDLPLAYGRGHPLRQLPDDMGDSCRVFELAESYR